MSSRSDIHSASLTARTKTMRSLHTDRSSSLMPVFRDSCSCENVTPSEHSCCLCKHIEIAFHKLALIMAFRPDLHFNLDVQIYVQKQFKSSLHHRTTRSLMQAAGPDSSRGTACAACCCSHASEHGCRLPQLLTLQQLYMIEQYTWLTSRELLASCHVAGNRPANNRQAQQVAGAAAAPGCSA